MLGTAVVKILDKNKKKHKCRLLLDARSQIHFVREKLMNKLQIPKQEIDMTLNMVYQHSKRTKLAIKVTRKSAATSCTCE